MKKYQGSYLSYFLMYMFYYLSMALFSGLISVYLMDKGYKASDVSLVVSSSFILSMITQPFIGNLCDRFDKKIVNGILLSIAGIFGVIFIFVNHIYMIAFVYSLVLAILNGVNSIIERMATVSSHKYGLIRIWGTIGYASGSQLSGLIYRYISPEAMYVFFVVGMVLCAIGIFGTQDVKEIEEKGKEKTSMKDVFLNKKLIFYILITCIFYGMTNVNSIYLPAMYQHNGLTISQATTVIFAGSMMELPVILLSRYYMNKIGNKQLLILTFLLLMIQFMTYAFIPYVMIQVIVTFLTKSVATMAFIMINMKVIATIIDSQHQISALSIVSTFKSFSSIIFQALAGYLIDLYSYQFFYIFLFGFAVIGLVLCIIYKIPSGNEHRLFD
ncbi:MULTISPECIES: MFS transporter [Coprobacillaceae]|uniref:MFS transporter n=1 Tax=Coprobacillaceae TaxID=2810280 RepID=UPI000E49A03E|nr:MULTISPECIES: MFS transporter [Coprobacillaceae]RHM61878.1 MFS transporter [Coprobacillus sp. AF33-1AC]RHS94695.1 MFS transporter [Erysipelatoclostridium sp. AM42-17]